MRQIKANGLTLVEGGGAMGLRRASNNGHFGGSSGETETSKAVRIVSSKSTRIVADANASEGASSFYTSPSQFDAKLRRI